MNEEMEWECCAAAMAVSRALTLGLKQDFLDYLSDETYDELFENYVPKKMYDELKMKYDICSMSGKLSTAALNRI